MSAQHNYLFTTGSTCLPDIGELSYNGVTFSSLFASKLSGRAIKDNANRTVKYMEYTLEASGVVTIGQESEPTIDTAITKLRMNLDQQAGLLTYTGRGFGKNVVINAPGSVVRDVAWGPVPETLDFQPLGGGLSAYVTWKVTFRLSEYAVSQITGSQGNKNNSSVLQFTVENVVTYDDECYSQRSISGTIEIPLTRRTVNDRTSFQSVDDFRKEFITDAMQSIDLTRFRVTRRSFPISRDRRTMDFEIVAEEIAPMGDPPGAVNARGRFTVRPSGRKSQFVVGLVQWTCSLSITYTIRKDKQRRLAWLAFQYMLWYRMQYSEKGFLGPIGREQAWKLPQNLPRPAVENVPPQKPNAAKFYANPVLFYQDLGNNRIKNLPGINRGAPGMGFKAFLIDFGIDEGLHRDSKTVTFEASWLLRTRFPYLLQSCGLWRVDTNAVGGQVWALSMQDVQGWKSWETNAFDAKQDVIVDMGGP